MRVYVGMFVHVCNSPLTAKLTAREALLQLRADNPHQMLWTNTREREREREREQSTLVTQFTTLSSTSDKLGSLREFYLTLF